MAQPIPVLLFAALREAAGCDRVEISLPPGSTPEEVRAAVASAVPELSHLVSACRVAADHAFVPEDAPIGPARELALIPPVSGGHTGHPRVAVRATPIVPAEVEALVRGPEAGALVTFTGTVRRRSRGATVDHLVYEAYVPMAERVLARIAGGLEADIPGCRVAIHHRVGTLRVGEVAVVVAVAAPHRAEAFDACRRGIEALKADAPIWKKEVAESGAVWVGMGP